MQGFKSLKDDGTQTVCEFPNLCKESGQSAWSRTQARSEPSVVLPVSSLEVMSYFYLDEYNAYKNCLQFALV